MILKSCRLYACTPLGAHFILVLLHQSPATNGERSNSSFALKPMTIALTTARFSAARNIFALPLAINFEAIALNTITALCITACVVKHAALTFIQIVQVIRQLWLRSLAPASAAPVVSRPEIPNDLSSLTCVQLKEILKISTKKYSKAQLIQRVQRLQQQQQQ